MKYVEACRNKSWHLMLTEECIDDARPVVYRCRSWRHNGECCQWKGAQDFVRVKEGIESRGCWVYAVLTFAQNEWWDWREQYTLSYPMWSQMRLRLTRRYGPIAYIQTWERHVKQGIHVNLLISNRDIWERTMFGCDEWLQLFLRPSAIALGFGPRCWAEHMRDNSTESMAGYLTKLARELVGAGNKGQVPYDAPPHFRRLRASRGVLPPVHKSDLTGWLVQTPMDNINRLHLPICPDSL